MSAEGVASLAILENDGLHAVDEGSLGGRNGILRREWRHKDGERSERNIASNRTDWFRETQKTHSIAPVSSS
jgi:hypothetical protein